MLGIKKAMPLKEPEGVRRKLLFFELPACCLNSNLRRTGRIYDCNSPTLLKIMVPPIAKSGRVHICQQPLIIKK